MNRFALLPVGNPGARTLSKRATQSVTACLVKACSQCCHSNITRLPSTRPWPCFRSGGHWLALTLLTGLFAVLAPSASFAQANPGIQQTPGTSLPTAAEESSELEMEPPETTQPTPTEDFRSLFQLLAGSDTIMLQGFSPKRYSLVQRFGSSSDPGIRRLGTLLTDLYIHEDIDAYYTMESQKMGMKMARDIRSNIARDFTRELFGGDGGLPMRGFLEGTLESQQASREFSRRTQPQRRYLDRRILINAIVTQARELALQAMTNLDGGNPLKPLIREPNRSAPPHRMVLELRNTSNRTLKHCFVVVETRASPNRVADPALVAPFGGIARNSDEAALLLQPQMAVGYAAELGPGKTLYVPLCTRFALWLAEDGTYDLFSEDVVAVGERLSELIERQRSIAWRGR